MNSNTTTCETKILKNKSKLYWQFNCNRIWLTLENINGEKHVIDEVDKTVYSYTYRLGYQLIKEYKNNLLFRCGCGANGPCAYKLIDKSNGKIIKEFNQLICIDTDILEESEYKFDFVLYLDSNNIIIDFLETSKKLIVPFNEIINSSIPEHNFLKMSLVGSILKLKYKSDKNIEKQITINLSDKKYSSK